MGEPPQPMSTRGEEIEQRRPGGAEGGKARWESSRGKKWIGRALSL
jgi:hypothetical protein